MKKVILLAWMLVAMNLIADETVTTQDQTEILQEQKISCGCKKRKKDGVKEEKEENLIACENHGDEESPFTVEEKKV